MTLFSRKLLETRSEPSTFGAYYQSGLNITIFANQTAIYACPIFFNTLANSLVDESIEIKYQSFPQTEYQKVMISGFQGFMLSLIIAIALSFLPAAFIVFIVRE